MDIDYITRAAIKAGSAEAQRLLRIEALLPRPRDLNADEATVKRCFDNGVWPLSALGTLQARVWLSRN